MLYCIYVLLTIIILYSSQIQVLNQDFAGQSGDAQAINTNIRFELAGTYVLLACYFYLNLFVSQSFACGC